MFSRDVKDFTYRTPRSIGEAFGPYSSQKLHVPRRKSRLRKRIESVAWIGFYGVSIAAFWYALIQARVA